MEDKYALLTCIQDCPDTWISKETLFNILKWNYDRLDNVINSLLKEKLIKSMVVDDVTRYKVSNLGTQYIESFLKSKSKDFFDKYLFPIILSIISFVLGLISSLILK